MLPSRVSVPRSAELLEPEDIFDSGFNALFTDDAQNSHGTPGQSVVYASPRFGDIILRIPAHPDVDESRRLFAHYLWNAGIVVADAIECASTDLHEDFKPEDYIDIRGKPIWEKKYWDVKNREVLELGAGTALPSIIAALSNARSTTITDHPSSPAITTDTISLNVRANLFKSTDSKDDSNHQVSLSSSCVSVHGYVWGESVFMSSTQFGKPSSPQPPSSSFNKIIIADCLWMPSQHVNLIKTILQYLAPDIKRNVTDEKLVERSDANFSTTVSQETSLNCALVVAGFHTGRAKVAEFFRIATGSTTAGDDQEADVGDIEEVKAVKGSLKADSIFEIDINSTVRPWLPVRPREVKEEAKRWCVVAALVRR